MKLRPLAAVSVFAAALALGCTKKPTPDFESEVSAWQRSQCSCYATATELDQCTTRAPETELNEVEHLMVNAGVLTDARRDTVRDAEAVVRGCAQAASDRARERDRQRLFEAAKVDLSGVVVPQAAKRTDGTKKRR